MPENVTRRNISRMIENNNWFEMVWYGIEWGGCFDTCVRHEFLFRLGVTLS
jgi:hypothetical protein